MATLEELKQQLRTEKAKQDVRRDFVARDKERKMVKKELFALKNRKKLAFVKGVAGGTKVVGSLIGKGINKLNEIEKKNRLKRMKLLEMEKKKRQQSQRASDLKLAQARKVLAKAKKKRGLSVREARKILERSKTPSTNKLKTAANKPVSMSEFASVPRITVRP